MGERKGDNCNRLSLRIHNQFPSDNRCGFPAQCIFGRFPSNMSLERLNQPIGLQQDQLVIPPGLSPEDIEQIQQAGIISGPWKISERLDGVNDESSEKQKRQRRYEGIKELTDHSNYFVLLPGPTGIGEIFPISSLYNFQIKISDSEFNEHQPPDDYDAAYENSLQERRILANLQRKKNDDDDQATVASALTLTNIRNSLEAWDYDDAARSDDEEIKVTEDAEETLGDDEMITDAIPTDLSNSILSRYGRAMKVLLKQQEDEQISDKTSIDDSEKSVDQSQRTQNQSQASTLSRTQRASGESNNSSDLAGPKLSPTEEEMERRVLRVLQQHQGLMNIKTFMIEFNVKDRNEEFRMLQSVIQRTCATSTREEDGKKVKYIVLKSQYRI